MRTSFRVSPKVRGTCVFLQETRRRPCTLSVLEKGTLGLQTRARRRGGTSGGRRRGHPTFPLYGRSVRDSVRETRYRSETGHWTPRKYRQFPTSRSLLPPRADGHTLGRRRCILDVPEPGQGTVRVEVKGGIILSSVPPGSSSRLTLLHCVHFDNPVPTRVPLSSRSHLVKTLVETRTIFQRTPGLRYRHVVYCRFPPSWTLNPQPSSPHVHSERLQALSPVHRAPKVVEV